MFVIMSVSFSGNMYKVIWIIILSLYTVSSTEQDNSVVISIPSGDLKGLKTIAPGTNDVVYQFKKVPYAKPPIGELRFMKPAPYGKWEGTLDATEFGPNCMQNLSSADYFTDLPNREISEDCLFMNIYVPNKKEKKMPVMVWVHGGAYLYGQGMYYNASNLAAAGNVIVITFNYRLGFFGFYSLKDKAAIGNYGIWDQKMVFEWVHDNIEYFGGDPGCVTIFGESAGGFSVNLHALIPSNRGLFHRVIAQSGTSLSGIGLTHTSHILSNIVSMRARCQTPDGDATAEEIVACMKSKTAEEILEAGNLQDMADPTKIVIAILLGPVVDDELFPDKAENLLSDSYPDIRSFFHSLDFMTGYTNSDGSLVFMFAQNPNTQKYFDFDIQEGIPTRVLCDLVAKSLSYYHYLDNDDVTSAICKYYKDESSLSAQSMKAVQLFSDFVFVAPAVNAASLHAKGNDQSSTYLYKFSVPSPVPFGSPPPWFQGCGHADELIFFFGIQNLPLKGKIIPDDYLRFSSKVMSYWTNFAKTGNPNTRPLDANIEEWPRFNLDSQSYINLDINPESLQRPSPEVVKFWFHEIPKLLKGQNKSKRDEL